MRIRVEVTWYEWSLETPQAAVVLFDDDGGMTTLLTWELDPQEPLARAARQAERHAHPRLFD